MSIQKIPTFLAPTPKEWSEIIKFCSGASTPADAMQAAMMGFNLSAEWHHEQLTQCEKYMEKCKQVKDAVKKPNNVRKYKNTYRLSAVYKIVGLPMVELAKALGVGSSTIYSWRKDDRIPAKHNARVEKLINGKS